MQDKGYNKVIQYNLKITQLVIHTEVSIFKEYWWFRRLDVMSKRGLDIGSLRVRLTKN